MKDFDIYLKERLNEYDILVRERLTECDVIVESLAYRDYFSVDEYLLLAQCIERYQVLKLTSAASDIELSTHIDEMLKRCYLRLEEGAILHSEVRGAMERSFTGYTDAIALGTDEASLCARIFSEAESQAECGAYMLDFDAHTRFDGVELRTELDAELMDSARKLIMAENAVVLDNAVRASLRLFTEPEEGELTLSAGIQSYAFVKLRRVSELAGNTLSDLSDMTLNELDYTEYESI